MPAKLGSLFLTPALGPLNYAGQSIMARRVKDGLAQLEGTTLREALERGVQAVADEVGVPAGTVRAILPMVELDGLAVRITENHRLAYEQWDAHAGQTGIMDGIADLTIDGRAPDPSLCLLRLSRKMQLDKELAEPLAQLSDDIDRWEQLLQKSRTLIEDGEALERAWKQRRLVRYGLVAAGGLAVLAVIIWSVRVYLARDRVEAALAAQDPCAATVFDGDRNKASDAQLAALAEKAKACTALREKAAAEERDRRAKEEARRRAEAAKRAYADRCRAVAEAMRGAGDLPDGLGSPGASILSRIRRGRFAAEDAAVTKPSIPCLDTDARDAIASAYAKAALLKAAVWLRTTTLSETAQGLLATGVSAVAAGTRKTFFMHVENVAKRTLLYGTDEEQARTLTLCDTAKTMGTDRGEYCRSLASGR